MEILLYNQQMFSIMWLKENELLLTDVETEKGDQSIEDLIRIGLRDMENSYGFFLHQRHAFTSWPQSSSELRDLNQQLSKIPKLAKYAQAEHPVSETETVLILYGDRFLTKDLPLGKFQAPNFIQYARYVTGFPCAVYEFDPLLLEAIKKQNDFGELFQKVSEQIKALYFGKENKPSKSRRKKFLINFSKAYDGSRPEEVRKKAATLYCEKLLGPMFENITGELNTSLRKSKMIPRFSNSLGFALRKATPKKRDEIRWEIEDLVTIDPPSLPRDYIDLLREKVNLGNMLEKGYVKLDFSNEKMNIFLNAKKGIEIKRRATAKELAQMPSMAFDLEKEQWKTKDAKLTPICSVFNLNEGYCDLLRDPGESSIHGVDVRLYENEEELLKAFDARVKKRNPYIIIGQNHKGYDIKELEKKKHFSIGDNGKKPRNYHAIFGNNAEIFGKEQHDFSLFKNFCILSAGKAEVIAPYFDFLFKKIINYRQESELEKIAIKGDKKAGNTLAKYCIEDVLNLLIGPFKKHRINEYMFEIGMAYENKAGLAMHSKTQQAIARKYWYKYKNQKKEHPSYEREEQVDEILRLVNDSGIREDRKVGLMEGSIVYLPILEETTVVKEFLQDYHIAKFYGFIEGKDDPLEKLDHYKRRDMHYHVIKPFAEEIWKDRDMVRKVNSMKPKLLEEEFVDFYGFTPGEFDLSMRQTAEQMVGQVRDSGLRLVSTFNDILFFEGKTHFEDKRIVNYTDVRMINGQDFTLALINGQIISNYGISYHQKLGKSDYEKETLVEVVEAVLKDNSIEKSILKLHKVFKDLSNNKVDPEELAYKTKLNKHFDNYKKESKTAVVARQLGLKEKGEEVHYVPGHGRLIPLKEAEKKDYNPEVYLAKIFGPKKPTGSHQFEKGNVTRVLEPLLFYKYLPKRKDMLEKAILTGEIDPALLDVDYEKMHKTYNKPI